MRFMGLAGQAAIDGLERNLWNMWSVFGRGDGCSLVDTPELLRFETPIPHVPYNSVMRFQVNARVDETIDEVLDAYDSRAVPLMWVVHPNAAPSSLGARLEARGLVEGEVCAGMVAPLSRVPAPEPFPQGVTLDRLGPATRHEFVELVAWRYSVPSDEIAPLLSILDVHGFGRNDCPTTAWVARLHGRVVSKAIVHLAEGVAGLYGVATRAEARGLGIARNLTMLAFDHARRLGYTVGVLHSTPMAVNLYASLGFSQVADFRLYSTPGALHL